MTNKLLDGCSDEDCVLLVLQDPLVALGREDTEKTRDDIGTICKLVLTSLIEAERSNCIRDCLNDLNIAMNRCTQDINNRYLPRSLAQDQIQRRCRTPLANRPPERQEGRSARYEQTWT